MHIFRMTIPALEYERSRCCCRGWVCPRCHTYNKDVAKRIFLLTAWISIAMKRYILSSFYICNHGFELFLILFLYLQYLYRHDLNFSLVDVKVNGLPLVPRFLREWAIVANDIPYSWKISTSTSERPVHSSLLLCFFCIVKLNVSFPFILLITVFLFFCCWVYLKCLLSDDANELRWWTVYVADKDQLTMIFPITIAQNFCKKCWFANQHKGRVWNERKRDKWVMDQALLHLLFSLFL
jgi:hypothetical protein